MHHANFKFDKKTYSNHPHSTPWCAAGARCIDAMAKQGSFGKQLPLRCVNHPDDDILRRTSCMRAHFLLCSWGQVIDAMAKEGRFGKQLPLRCVIYAGDKVLNSHTYLSLAHTALLVQLGPGV